MANSSPIWSIPLNARPRIAFLGIGVHGPARREHHRVQGYWCLHLYPYSARLEIEGSAIAIQPGYAGILPPDADTHYSFPAKCQHACAHFSLPDDGARQEIPAMQDIGGRFGAIYQAMEEAIASAPTNPLRAEVRL